MRVSAIELLSAQERAVQLGAWAGEVSEYPRETTIAGLFAGQAAATPKAVALVFGERRLSYAG